MTVSLLSSLRRQSLCAAPAFATVLAAALLLALPSQAADVFLVDDNASGESWDTAGDWSDNAVPNGANDYFVGPAPGPTTIRTPNVVGPIFGGASLTLHGGSFFGLSFQFDSLRSRFFVSDGQRGEPLVESHIGIVRGNMGFQGVLAPFGLRRKMGVHLPLAFAFSSVAEPAR